MWPSLDSGRWDSTAAMAGIVASQVTGVICGLAGICLLVETWGDLRTGGNAATAVTRVLFFGSIGVTLFGIGAALGTLTTPAEMEGFIWGAKGTVRTCEIQGVLLCQQMLYCARQ